jgi:hypothetical protein
MEWMVISSVTDYSKYLYICIQAASWMQASLKVECSPVSLIILLFTISEHDWHTSYPVITRFLGLFFCDLMVGIQTCFLILICKVLSI